MSYLKIKKAYEQLPLLKQLTVAQKSRQDELVFKGLSGSSLSFVLGSLTAQSKVPLLCVFNDKETAAYYFNDFEAILGQEETMFYPGSYRRPYELEETDNANVMLRAEVLNQLQKGAKVKVLVSYPEALFEKVLSSKELIKFSLNIGKGDALGLDFLNETLFEYEFKRVDFVSEPGEFSVRGGLVDVFSYANENPYRIEFFGEKVESIREFDVATQLSIRKTERINILPNVENKALVQKRQSFLECLPAQSLIYCQNTDFLFQQTDKLFSKALSVYGADESLVKKLTPEMLFCNSETHKQQLQKGTVIGPGSSLVPNRSIVFQTDPQQAFNRQFDLLVNQLKENTAAGYKNYLFCSNKKQAQRFAAIFEELEETLEYKTVVGNLYRGFTDHRLKLACYTDHQIFERYYKFRLKNGYAKKQALTLRELNNLQPGDYVTHIDHGVGKFGGLQKIHVDGHQQEAIKLSYGERDVLYVSIHSLHKITPYKSKDAAPPKIYKLGSAAWKKLRQKTKKRVKEVAFSLIELYAQRRAKKGYQYAPDSYLQNELEASFLFEDTPDQGKATLDVKADMESERPMDRLVCGDVGFGKTEVAIRAAFKAVDNGKQVAVLVPTTILAFQHHKNFNERLKDFPITVEYINRFRSTAQKRRILEELKEGKVDILIGTHLLVNEKTQFKDLGLLVVDEEQKFGVSVKEKLKNIKKNVDVLTLTATPIPRTLQFGLMAARDLSVIKTPPPNRHPIESRVVSFNEELIRDAISYEIQRSGQVFFVHNRITNINEVAGLLQRLVPDAKIGVGHGRMEGKKLEKLMLDFINGDFDVLVSTTIIENGLDVPNANTIFINYANNFGLSDLHQMRGRVGRSNRKAFCYFITPPYSVLTPDARRRMEALEEYTALGSGFEIAMKDLEIRGAGDILGAEQSGFINDIGFETYQKILEEAVEELKENEFKELYPDFEPDIFVKDVQIDNDFELLFPDTYVNMVSERLNLYKELNTLKNTDELLAYKTRLTDRFGSLPRQAEELLQSVELKWLCARMGIEKLVLKKQSGLAWFISDPQSAFFQSAAFQKVLLNVQQHAVLFELKEKETRSGMRLILKFEDITSVKKAIEVLQKLLPAVEKVGI